MENIANSKVLYGKELTNHQKFVKFFHQFYDSYYLYPVMDFMDVLKLKT